MGEGREAARSQGGLRGLSARRAVARRDAVAACIVAAWLVTIAGAGAERARAASRARAVGWRRRDGRRQSPPTPSPGRCRRLTRRERSAFAVGNSFFNRNWVTAPGVDRRRATASARRSTPSRARRATSRTVARSRRRATREPELGLLLRLSRRRARTAGRGRCGCTAASCRTARSSACRPRAGSASRTRRCAAATPTARRTRCSPAALRDRRSRVRPAARRTCRSARASRPACSAWGCSRRCPSATILARADPGDADGDGISGRANRVGGERSGGEALGRFGWKANEPTVEQQNAGAFQGDIGDHEPGLRGRELRRRASARASARRTAGEPEIDERKLERVTLYTRTLAVPARRSGPRRGHVAPASAVQRARLLGLPPARAADRHERRRRPQPRRTSARTPTCCCTTWGRASPTGGPTAWRRARSGGPRRCGASASCETVNGHSASCTTAARAASRRRSCGTAARRAAATARFRALPRRARQELDRVPGVAVRRAPSPIGRPWQASPCPSERPSTDAGRGARAACTAWTARGARGAGRGRA